MVSYDFTGDRITSLEKDRKQMQTTLENLQYAMSLVENQLNNNDYEKQVNEIYKILYCVVIGFIIVILNVIN
jgi:hypothetical protein